jgi:uncharacterized iron-regulated membrane protein
MAELPPEIAANTVARNIGGGRRWRWLLQQLHLWVGLALCVPLVVLGLTGSILVFEHELRDLFDPLPRTQAGESKGPGAIIAAASAKAPNGATPTFFVAPEEPGAPAAVRFAQRGAAPGPGGFLVHVDPVSLEVLGAREANAGVLRQIFMLHANLLTRDRSGREIIGWLGVVMCGLGITGLVLWWPRAGQWRSAFGVRRGARGLRLHRDLHGTVGIWGLMVFLVVSFSGTYLAFPQTLGAAVRAVVPARDLRTQPTVTRPTTTQVPGERPLPLDADAALALARTVVADGTLRSIALPNRPDQTVRVAFLPPGGEHGEPTITVFIDPWTRRVIEVRDPRSYTAGEVALAWQHALHAGEGLGWLWKGLVFVSGFMPTLFVITGIWMWLIKRRAKRAVLARRIPAAEPAE